MPNVLRALVFEDAGAPIPGDVVMVIAFDVDDMTGEEIGVAADRLRDTDGVLDLTLGMRQGKKGRPVSEFRLLVRPALAEAVAERCFAETSTIGLRLHDERRLTLVREARNVAGTPVKLVQRPGGATRKAESDALAGESLAERRAAKLRAESGDD